MRGEGGYNAFSPEETWQRVCEVKGRGVYRYLVVKGDSMAPYIREGYLAPGRLQRELKSGVSSLTFIGTASHMKKYYYAGGAVTLVPFTTPMQTVTHRA
jgi:hypothetical protein